MALGDIIFTSGPHTKPSEGKVIIASSAVIVNLAVAAQLRISEIINLYRIFV